MSKTAAPPFDFRPTGPDTFMVDLDQVYLGTVQQFSSHEWWAYPASTGDALTPITRTTREAAALALLAHATGDEVDRLVAGHVVAPPQDT